MRTRVWLGVLVGLMLVVGVAVALPDTPTGYVARAAVHQARLLTGRVPLDQYAPRTEQARGNLARIPAIERFARERVGLDPQGQYRTVQPRHDGPMWNVSACGPLSLTPRRFWFPIVGSVPYLGFFDRDTAERRAERLRADGLEVWVRPAGTYSTLGWFDDPVLPPMLDWSERRLAETLVHEWVHASVWISGSVAFNESLASFVGDRAAVRWLEERYGPGSAAVRSARIELEDDARWRGVVDGLLRELGELYASDRPDADKLARKAELLGTLPERVSAAGLRDPLDYEQASDPAGWNNARLAQFRAYNRGYEAFEVLLTRADGDLRGFLDLVRALPRGDPWSALSEASGVAAETVQDF